MIVDNNSQKGLAALYDIGMADIAAVASVLNLIGLGGLGVFIYYVIKGLRERITALTQLAEEQAKTLDTVRTRAIELDQLRKDYRQALDDFQDIGHKLEERRSAVIHELEIANRQKDEELARLKTLELQEIELKRRSLDRLPELEERLAGTVEELGRQIRVVAEGLVTEDVWRRPIRLATVADDVCLYHDWDSNVARLVAPSGSGKSLLLSYLVGQRLAQWKQRPAHDAPASQPKVQDITSEDITPQDATPPDMTVKKKSGDQES